MAVISAATYFIKYPIKLDVSNAIKIELIDSVTDFCEDKYLKSLLGTIEYYKYVDDKALVTHDAKYTALMTAANFTHNDVTYRLDIKQMIAYFTYCECLKDNSSYSTSLGQQSSNVEGSTKVSPRAQYVTAYNLGIKLYDIAKLYLYNQVLDFPDYVSEGLKSTNIYGI
jgi:hypothetical protein